MTRRLAAAAVAVVAGLALLVAAGRRERDVRAERQVEGMRAVVEAVGALDDASLHGFRVLPSFDCLVYRRGANPYALELCADDEGRVLEAIDRRGAERRIWSLRDDPAHAELRVDRPRLDELLSRLGVPDRLLPTRGGGGP